MATVPNNLAELKARMRASRMAGDFGEIAKLNAGEAEGFIRRINLKPGTKVLDVACGTGNQSIPAARAGADRVHPASTSLPISWNRLANAPPKPKS